jgi:quercetin dioxygenase-like cupin family protein
MTIELPKGWPRVAAAAVLAISSLTAMPASSQDQPIPSVQPVFADKLPNVPGKSLTAVVVSYPPGGHSQKHHHAGSVFAYVLSGAIRSATSTLPERVYHAGESFFEPAGTEHLVSENASATAPASLLAVFVADDGAQLTMQDK